MRINPYDKKEKDNYELSLNRLADNYAIKKNSYKEGREEEKIEGIKAFLHMNVVSISQIATAFRVDEAYVLKIKKGLKEENKGV